MRDLHKLHANLIKTGLIKDHIAASRVLAFCATTPFGDINYASLVFRRIQNPNLFIWNTIVRGFSQSSAPRTAVSLFFDMLVNSDVVPDRLTYPSLFKACAQLGVVDEGMQLHARVIKLGVESDRFVRNTVMFMYMNCDCMDEAGKIFDEDGESDVVAWNSMIMGFAKHGLVEESRRLFDKMQARSTVSWNSMIGGYARNGRFSEAFELFQVMQRERVRPSEFTTVSLLSACARLGALEQGRWIHAYINKNNFELNSIVLTSIIDMYCKCGSSKEAFEVFRTASQKGISCWNAMIMGLAVNGQNVEAIQLFSKLQTSGLGPNDVTFISILTACSHSGMVNEAKHYFSLMTQKYKIKPTVKHYSCMVDVLGRAGLLEEAEELITKMPMKPDPVVWGSLLSACREHGNIEMGKRAAKRLTELDPSDSGSYIILSNTYASSGRHDEAMHIRNLMKEKQIRKQPGSSLIEVNGVVHEFVVGGILHPRATEIYALVKDLGLMLKNKDLLNIV